MPGCKAYWIGKPGRSWTKRWTKQEFPELFTLTKHESKPDEDGQAGVWTEWVPVRPPARDLVEKCRERVCPAMFLAGSSEYFSWLSEQGAEPDVGELVSRVYRAMTTQRIARNRQMASKPREPAKSKV